MFNPVAPYRYLLPTVCLSVTDIANPDLLACGCRTRISLDIARFYEEQFQRVRMADLLKKTVIGPLFLVVGGVDTICITVCQTVVTTCMMCRLESLC